MQSQERSLGVGKAILVGHLMVNLPVMVIILSATGFGMYLGNFVILGNLPPRVWFLGILALFLIGGGGCAWLWWSFAVPRWRRWALQNGAPADRLQKWAVVTGLVWPKGSIFEKTEFKVD